MLVKVWDLTGYLHYFSKNKCHPYQGPSIQLLANVCSWLNFLRLGSALLSPQFVKREIKR